MRLSRALLVGTVAFGLTVAACSGASRLNALRFTAPPAPTLAMAQGRPVPLGPRSMRLGIDLDFYAWPGMTNAQLLGDAQKDIAYIQSLHANAVAITFPFYMRDRKAAGVQAGNYTPTPAEVSAVAREAMAAGLHVSIRPLLDENSIKGPRNHWKPRSQATWFASYEQFLKPYLQAAQGIGVPEVVTGVEFSKFSNSPYWARLDARIRRWYSGKLSYANNWGRKQIPPSVVNRQGVEITVDAYRPLQLGVNSSQAQVDAAWIAYGRTLPRGIVLSEVGLTAQPGAYRKPYAVDIPGMPLRPEIQARWFTGACHAAVADHMGGIYYWAMNFNQDTTAPPTARHPSSFVDGAGARAIASCFQWIGRRSG